ncbi:MAG: SRPBCC family protein [Rubrobacter sp.]|jgi:carbon monoxide dehydrogenase subunit G|nr:SRPBCC family protein [Rubrobacter sp.]
MKIENEFTVGVPVEEAWKALQNLEEVAPCLPGASVEGSEGDEYKGTMTVKLGPITARYTGTVRYAEVDEENRRMVLQASGRDARGQGTASATITSTLRDEEGGTHVRVETDMRLTGRAAQFGRGIQQDVATKMLTQFAECLERKLSGEEEAPPQEEERPQPAQEEEQPRVRRIQQPEPEPLDLGEMGREAVMERLKQAAPAIAGAAVLLLIVIWLLRR